MYSDFHVHTKFSGDSQADVKQVIERAVCLGMKHLCITDHQDFDYPYDDVDFEFNTDQYFKELSEWKEYFKGKIDLRIGVELGLQPYLKKRLEKYVSAYPFDFIIGSSHLVNGKDPYYPEYFKDRSEEECYREYFQSIIDNVGVFQDFDVYGHLDYIVRYGTNRQKNYSYMKYQDIIDLVLKEIIEAGIGIECNTAGLKYGLGFPNPHPDILKRYKQLGGEIITLGSDGHEKNHIGYDFFAAAEILKAAGFRYYTVFKKRKPEFIPI
jgi:histidinol-phosphatase (PHP family)